VVLDTRRTAGSRVSRVISFCCALDLCTAEGRLCRRALRRRPPDWARTPPTLIGARYFRGSYLGTQTAAGRSRHTDIDYPPDTWTTQLSPSHRTRAGSAWVRRGPRPGIPIYDRHADRRESWRGLSAATPPTIAVLAEALTGSTMQVRYGRACELHSMPFSSSRKKRGRCAVFVLGDSRRHNLDPRNSPI